MFLVYGKIAEVLADKALYRVNFDDRDMVSQPLPRINLNTIQNKDEAHFDTDEHVACIMDENFENGIILGAFYDANNLPLVGSKDKRRTTYSDGSFVQFDRSAKKLTISCEGDIEVVKATNVKITASEKVQMDATTAIEFNGGTQGEMILIDAFTTAINNRFTLFKTSIAAGFAALSGLDSGASATAFNTPMGSDTSLNKTTNNYKNPKIKQ